MTQESQKVIPPYFQVLLMIARGLYFTAGNLMFVAEFLQWRAKGYTWPEPSVWLALLGLVLMFQAFFGLTYKWLRTFMRVQPVLVAYTLWSMVVTGAGFLVLAFFWAIT
ncbi:hypothetical protein [Meiothermus sp. CFH 77666]|uniref:hypothetical protein n=1 Tax=Meiothermus sp. CFH 77666 TaxID=2817942 RepID=UPI001AA01A13|nr:hypothetical protein [Meiothermus sp. CFH 77666]MBO1438245.1 hypothetical protein [Meiothermus sp. CFH 77666]